MADTPPGPHWGTSVLISSPSKGVVGTPEDFSRQVAEMQNRLADPQLREQLRMEQRAQIQELNPELAQVLGLDPQTETRLVELLTDQQMEHLERFWAEQSQLGNAFNVRAPVGRIRMRAEDGSRRIEAIRTLIGEQGYERYRDYQHTLRERQAVNDFERYLQHGDRLTPEQKDRLMALLQQQFDDQSRARRRDDADELSGAFSVTPRDHDAIRRRNVARNQRLFWRMREESRLLIGRLPEVLTPAQVAVFAQLETEKIDAQRRYVEQMRAAAGMAREIPPPTQTDDGPARKPVEGLVKLEVMIRVDGGDPVSVSEMTENDQAISFAGPQSLWVEATPTLFNNGWAEVSLEIYEQKDGQRRAAGSVGMGFQTRRPRPFGRMSSGATVHGDKVYALEFDARVTPVEESP